MVFGGKRGLLTISAAFLRPRGAVPDDRELDLEVASVAAAAELVTGVAELSPPTPALDDTDPGLECGNTRVQLAAGGGVAGGNSVTPSVSEADLDTELLKEASIQFLGVVSTHGWTGRREGLRSWDQWSR